MKKLSILILILMSGSLCSQWLTQTSGTTAQLNDAWMFTASDVIAVGNSGIILRTTNGGINWNPVTSGTTAELSSVFFINANTGWIYGNGTILKTVNGGSVWNSINNLTGFGKMFFISDQNGWSTAGGNYVRKTTNGGANWSISSMPVLSLVWETYFVNSNTGYALGSKANDSTYVYRSVNGGTNWEVFKGLTKKYISLSVIDLNNIYLGGYDGDFIKTNNGGATWENITVDVNSTFNDINFINNSTGYVCGTNGKVYATFNGGATWQSQSPGTSNALNRVVFSGNSNETGFITGSGGLILKTTNGGVSAIQNISNEVPAGFELSQNYPNPFNPVTNIRIKMPEGGLVKLTVFDITGREAAILVNENLKAGEYKVDFNASSLPSGVYFYRLTSDDFNDVKKMILVK